MFLEKIKHLIETILLTCLELNIYEFEKIDFSVQSEKYYEMNFKPNLILYLWNSQIMTL